jgi:UDP-glucuronate decarboxylase
MLIGIIIYLTMQSSTNSGSNFGTVQQQAPNFDSTAVRSYINNQVDGKFMSMIKQDTEFGKKFPPVKVLPQHLQLRILITGGAGFVGSHLTDRLMTAGHLVYVVDNFFTGRKRNVEHWVGHPNFQLILHDIVDPIHIEVDQIYHLACPASPPHYMYNPIKTIKTSTEGTLNMLGLAKRVHARMLLTSTSEVYGDPEVHPQKEDYWGHVNPIGPRACYDEGKRVAETMMYAYEKQQHLEVRVARIFNTFGPRMHPNDGRVVSNFIIQALQNRDITIYGDGSQTRSFQYVDDLVEGLIRLMNGNYSKPVNIGNPQEFTVKDFAETIKQKVGSQSEIKLLPATQDDPRKRKPDISTARKYLNWEPIVPVSEGVEKTIEYFKKELEKEGGTIIPTGPNAAKPKPVASDAGDSTTRLTN